MVRPLKNMSVCRFNPTIPNLRPSAGKYWRNQGLPKFPRMRWARLKDGGRSATLKYRYGISVEVWNLLFEKQEGKCSACKQASKLHVDHDHTTGRVRGLLCQKCNCALGLLDDSFSRIAYLLEYKKSHE
jgi:hypothetical protein